MKYKVIAWFCYPTLPYLVTNLIVFNNIATRNDFSRHDIVCNKLTTDI